jgi:hypothetical protein
MDSALRSTLTSRPWWAGPRIALFVSPIAGLASGSWSASDPSRAVLPMYAAIKMPLLVLGTTAICLPFFFVAHVALGLRREFGVALRGVLGGQAMFAIVLASLAPFIPVWYSAVESRRLAVIANALVFTIAAGCSLVAVRRVYRLELPRRSAHTALLACWLILYSFVGMQAGWMLRPFIGSADAAPSFLRETAFTNGYVAVWRLLRGA